jgi:hypothetical protein
LRAAGFVFTTGLRAGEADGCLRAGDLGAAGLRLLLFSTRAFFGVDRSAAAAGERGRFAGDFPRFAGDAAALRAGLFFAVRFFFALAFGVEGAATAAAGLSASAMTGTATPRRVVRFLPAGDFEAARPAGDAARFPLLAGDAALFAGDAARFAGDVATDARFFLEEAAAADVGTTLARERDERELIAATERATGNRSAHSDKYSRANDAYELHCVQQQ